MAIGLQKLSAGSGYEYLTRQVAALDVTGRGHVSLADYYAVKGEAPGIWWGSGLDAVGLTAGGEVTAEQMKLLFGAGLNPTTGEKLGRAYSVFAGEPTPFETELGSRLTAWQHTHGLEPAAPIPQQVRSQLRTELGREWFLAERGTLPEGPRELHAFIAKAISHPECRWPDSTSPSPLPSPSRHCGRSQTRNWHPACGRCTIRPSPTP